MGYDIPEPYVWDDSFKVFYENLDEEHKGLFKGIFDCAKAPGDGNALSHLLKVVCEHFSDEEGMMQKANYGDFAVHKQMHDDFVAKLKGLSCPLSPDTIHFAKDWLVNHIKGTDHKYKGKL
uniref:Hemerythrin n=2 Tax=Annelida TaxID=6340 RepID=A0A1S6QCG8_9ANNE|nr:hemerythrin [Arichlidon gathofi]AQV13718.1 hemerythrin [Oligochaeta sp. EP-2017]